MKKVRRFFSTLKIFIRKIRVDWAECENEAIMREKYHER